MRFYSPCGPMPSFLKKDDIFIKYQAVVPIYYRTLFGRTYRMNAPEAR
jgi:hypothetical protein